MCSGNKVTVATPTSHPHNQIPQREANLIPSHAIILMRPAVQMRGGRPFGPETMFGHVGRRLRAGVKRKRRLAGQRPGAGRSDGGGRWRRAVLMEANESTRGPMCDGGAKSCQGQRRGWLRDICRGAVQPDPTGVIRCSDEDRCSPPTAA